MIILYKGSTKSPHELTNNCFLPNLTQTEEQNRSKRSPRNYVIASSNRNYALCYALHSAGDKGGSIHYMIDGIPFVLAPAQYFDSDTKMNNADHYLYQLDTTGFQPADQKELEYISPHAAGILSYQAYSPREILEQGVQLYTAENLSVLIKEIIKLDKRSLRQILSRQKRPSLQERDRLLKKFLIESVTTGKLRHVNQ